MQAAVKSFMLVLGAGLLLALGSAGPAGAATPCWKALIQDWFDGRIDHTYPPSCYTQAIHHLPTDVKTYSSAKDDIESALQASLRQERGGSGGRGTASYDPKHPPSPGPSSEGNSKGVILRAIEWLGPSNAASVPLPLLILAGVAFLLLAAAGGSFLNRWLQARRLPPD
jgi:hypothetical protein